MQKTIAYPLKQRTIICRCHDFGLFYVEVSLSNMISSNMNAWMNADVRLDRFKTKHCRFSTEYWQTKTKEY